MIFYENNFLQKILKLTFKVQNCLMLYFFELHYYLLSVLFSINSVSSSVDDEKLNTSFI